MFGWLDRLADEGHRSETIARRWHIWHSILYVVLMASYAAMIVFHLSAAARHRRAARLLDAARRASSGVATDNDQGC